MEGFIINYLYSVFGMLIPFLILSIIIFLTIRTVTNIRKSSGEDLDKINRDYRVFKKTFTYSFLVGFLVINLASLTSNTSIPKRNVDKVRLGSVERKDLEGIVPSPNLLDKEKERNKDFEKFYWKNKEE